MIWSIGLADVDAVYEMAMAAYPKHFQDPEHIRRLAHIFAGAGEQGFYFRRSEDAFLLADLADDDWNPSLKRVFIKLVAATKPGLQGYRLMRDCVRWAREQGATTVHFSSDTDIDFGPWARRLGAVEEQPTYALALS